MHHLGVELLETFFRGTGEHVSARGYAYGKWSGSARLAPPRIGPLVQGLLAIPVQTLHLIVQVYDLGVQRSYTSRLEGLMPLVEKSVQLSLKCILSCVVLLVLVAPEAEVVCVSQICPTLSSLSTICSPAEHW